ncbi:hypothetical protein AZI87_16600 [Bdellovibrio bacteriovorus]|uniref:HRDC domain-containing protein n=2 Tax=Bdellovibrio bacteriovorus TaxID=959 RepID=A0A161PQH1_BDEBC|nr:hypothetical protein AZI87_16600 [Bdellovibrio bacteriovorus]
MRWFLIKLKRFLVNMARTLTIVCAVAMVLIPGTSLISKIFWVSLATLSVAVPLLKLFRGKRSDRGGYIFARGANEYEHRLIAKRVLKRDLFPNEVVHHINGKRSDNTLRNLCVMDRHQHELFHAWLDWKKKKSGRYPTFKEQKRVLCEDYKGYLLEAPSNFNFSFRTNKYSPVRRTFVVQTSVNSNHRYSEDYSQKLFSDLRQERNRLAIEQNIPAYLVFKNFTLEEMARQMPDDAASMANIIGVTSEKLRLYGDHFLAIIWKHRTNQDLNKKRSV